MKKIAGIYAISFNCGHKNLYYGSTNYTCRRKSQHLYNLRRDQHHNPILQSYFNKYGESAMVFKVIESILTQDFEYIRGREQDYLNNLFSRDDIKILNINKDAGSPYIEWSEERKEALRRSNRSRVWTKEAKEQMSILKTGLKYSEESNKKKSESLKAHYAKIKNNPTCKYCGSTYTRRVGSRSVKTTGQVKHRIRCADCNRSFSVDVETLN